MQNFIFKYFTTYDNISIRYAFSPCNGENTGGTAVLLSGRSEFIEKHVETVEAMNQRGFDVYSFDWRGQGLSTRILPNRQKGFVKTYEDYILDLEEFVGKIVQPGAVRPLIFLCHSMGSHIALRYLHDYTGIISKAVLVSPMIDVITYPFPMIFARILTRTAVKAGMAHAYALMENDYRPTDRKSFKKNKLSSDFHRYMDEKYAVDRNPDLALGGVTYGWLNASFDSIDILKNPGFAENINIPILMAGAGRDRVVPLSAQKCICRRLPNCYFKLISDSYHEILKEKKTVQAEFWKAFDKFTGKNS